ncbi:GNAT family N-acetyltransferase [Streptomyces sp. Tue6028]|uniref:GNAT family N-acetyltransferase n=1 Tax=Streptomyces sp. Tue6028 TaxID=2036037 RepID=UPI003D75D4B2
MSITLLESGLGRQTCLMLSRALVELEAVSVADSAQGRGLGHHLVDELVRSYTRQGYEAMLGGIHTHKPYLAPYYEADGFSVLSPGAPLDLQIPIGRIRFPAEPSMRHLVCPLVPGVLYRAGVVGGLLAGR